MDKCCLFRFALWGMATSFKLSNPGDLFTCKDCGTIFELQEHWTKIGKLNQGYIISFENGKPVTIVHLVCGVVSSHPEDIEHHYCGWCHRFLDLFAFEGLQGMPGLIRDALRWPKDVQ